MQSTIKSVATVIGVALFMSFSATSFSQTNQFGISINSLTTNFNYGKSNSALQPYKKNFTGLQAGVSYQAGITPMFSVVPELYFALKGGSLKANNPLTENNSTLRIYSIEMPLQARFHFNNLYLNAGPYVAYAVSGRLKTAGSEVLPEKNARVSFGNAAGEFKRWDAGLLAGVGYNFNLKKSILTLDARYGYGLVNISNDVARYNRMLNISLVVSKPGKKNNDKSQG